MQSLTQLRAVIADNSHACTFQNFRQYRNALINRIDSLTAAKQTLEPDMNKLNPMPLATEGYPYAHPYPCAVRRVAMLERLLLSGVIVRLDQLTRHTATAWGGMQVDKDHGPWVTLVDVMGHSRTPHQFTRDAAETFAQDLIALGWHNGDELCVDRLQELLAIFLTKHLGAMKP